MPLFKFVNHLIKKNSCLPFTRVWKDANESYLKIVKGSKNISCNSTWVNLIACTKSMTKTSQPCASLIKFFTMLKRGKMQARLQRALVKCSKLRAKAWIVGLSSAIFSNNGQYSYNTHLNGLNIKIPRHLDIVQDLKALHFHDLPQFNQFQMPLWRAKEIFV